MAIIALVMKEFYKSKVKIKKSKMLLKLFKTLFKSENSGFNLPDGIGGSEEQQQVIQAFSKLSIDKRIREIMVYGNSGEPKYYPLLKYAILYDGDINVKFAALKRIHLFKSHPDAITMLSDLKNKVNTNSLEPYYSMALSKMGIISLKELEEKLNNPNS